MKRRQVLTTMAIGALGAAQVARAQGIGSADRTIRVVVGFPPGGSTDTIARTVVPHMEKVMKATIIVDNKPGAGARLANTYVKSAKPDGNTLLLTSSSLMGVYPHVFKNLGYDPVRDYVPVVSVVNMEFGFVASAAAAPGIKTIREYVQWVKANPRNGNYGGVGVGSIPHFLGAMLARSGNVPLNYVPFNGGAPHLQALNGGQLPFGIDVTSGIVPHLSAGRVKLLATSGAERSLPDVPTIAEAGFRELTTEDYTGFFYPADTPAEFVHQVEGAVKVALQQPAVQESFRQLAFKPSGTGSVQLTQRVKADLERWRKVIEDTGFKPLD
jgi:tripartite-type tricarboxylate transporter receptor subunit TctC